jgi:hypothetical protein
LLRHPGPGASSRRSQYHAGASQSSSSASQASDSLADGLWAGLYTTLKKHPEDKLYRHSKVGTGLTNPSFNDWIKEMASALDADHPTNVVIMFGANDEQSVRDDNHKGYNFKSEGWKSVYVGRINAILSETAHRHRLGWAAGNAHR